MPTRTQILNSGGPLAAYLPNAQFAEYHYGIINAPTADAWQVLKRIKWSDLTLTKPLMRARRFGLEMPEESFFETFQRRAGAAYEEHGTTCAALMIGKPWSRVPQSRPAQTLSEVRARLAEVRHGLAAHSFER